MITAKEAHLKTLDNKNKKIIFLEKEIEKSINKAIDEGNTFIRFDFPFGVSWATKEAISKKIESLGYDITKISINNAEFLRLKISWENAFSDNRKNETINWEDDSL